MEMFIYIKCVIICFLHRSQKAKFLMNFGKLSIVTSLALMLINYDLVLLLKPSHIIKKIFNVL